MKAQRINSGFQDKYPYQYYINLREVDSEKAAAIVKWAENPGPEFTGCEFAGTVAGLGLYLRTESDLTAFLLRWA